MLPPLKILMTSLLCQYIQYDVEYVYISLFRFHFSLPQLINLKAQNVPVHNSRITYFNAQLLRTLVIIGKTSETDSDQWLVN